MAVQFIFGRSGTGKTSFCIKAITDVLLAPADNQPLILLVPEQASYQAERAILNDKRLGGYSRLHVLSFDRLQFLLSGKNTARPALSRLGRQMIVHRLLCDNAGRLKIFHSSSGRLGLARQMADTITELCRYSKSPDDVNSLLNELQKVQSANLTALKFADIGLVFAEYLKFVTGRFVDPDIQLDCTCRAVAQAPFVRAARLWVDGFAGFTTSQLILLTELLKAVSQAQIALCLNPSKIDLKNPTPPEPEPVSLFYPTECTYKALIELVRKNNIQMAEPVILDEPVRFSRCPQLEHIERNIFEPKPPKIPAGDSVCIVSAPNVRSEVKFVAGQILHLVREKNYRYRDIAVIASALDSYQHYIRAYFDDYAIPFFIDRQKPLNRHPVIGLICSALQAVTEGFLHSDIFAYLKTGLVPLEQRDIALLENYCLAFGIKGSDWLSNKEWDFADTEDFDQQCINRTRLKVIEPLLKLRDNLCPPDNTGKLVGAVEFTRIIFDFLDALKVSDQLARKAEKAAESGDYTAADEHRQFYDKLVGIFDELAEVFADRQMSCRDWFAIVGSAFSQMTMAFIPPTLDQVLVGSIERSRHPDLKAVFLIGATQKQFPVPVAYDSILTDTDRFAAESAGFTLAATAQQNLAQRQYLAYIAFTRPCQFLSVSYPLTDDKASAVVRSQFVDSLEALFENLREESVTDEQIELENTCNQTELADLLCSRLGRDNLLSPETGSDEPLGELLNDICADEQLAPTALLVRSALNYDNSAHLAKKLVEKLFTGQMTSSATRLSTFAACPYRYFARYTLELKKREEFKFEPLDLGALYHRVLDSLLKQLNIDNEDLAAIGDERLLQLFREQLTKLIQQDRFISNFVRHSPHNAFIITSTAEVLEDCVRAIVRMVRAGVFRPVLSELWFDKYKIPLAHNRSLLLRGKIDRLDIAETGGEKIALVFDYKRRDRSFSWSQFYYGLDMQLAIYMLAARSAGYSAIGAFYMPVEQTAESEHASAHKARGIFDGRFFQQLDAETAGGWSRFYNFYITSQNDQYGRYDHSGALKPDDFDKVLEFTEQKITELAQQILSGKIDVLPYRLGTDSPCGYCEYKPLCRFDWQINKYNILEPIGKYDVLEKIKAPDDRKKD
jgi:ATP-dependent helicase/nuclease subunit B